MRGGGREGQTYTSHEEPQIRIHKNPLPRRLRIVVDPIVWCHGAPADDAGGGGGGEGDDVGCCDGRRGGGVEEVFSADAEHDYEGYYVWDPGYGFVSEIDEDSHIFWF